MSVTAILTKALLWGGIYSAVVAIAGAIIGWLVSGQRGLIAALLAAVLTLVFLGLTAVSIILANRVSKGGMQDPGVFFGIVLGGWFLKLVIFFVAGFAFRGAAWFDPVVFGATVIFAVLGTLVIDLVTLVRSRPPAIDVPLPTVTDDQGEALDRRDVD